jgi:hypothetical protein
VGVFAYSCFKLLQRATSNSSCNDVCHDILNLHHHSQHGTSSQRLHHNVPVNPTTPSPMAEQAWISGVWWVVYSSAMESSSQFWLNPSRWSRITHCKVEEEGNGNSSFAIEYYQYNLGVYLQISTILIQSIGQRTYLQPGPLTHSASLVLHSSKIGTIILVVLTCCQSLLVRPLCPQF